MSQIDVIEQLKQRFAEPLEECAQRRIVVWHDADGEFEDQFDELSQQGLDGSGTVDDAMIASGELVRAIRFVKAEDGVMFAVKRLVNREDTVNDILLYRKQSRGAVEGDWLAELSYTPTTSRRIITRFWRIGSVLMNLRLCGKHCRSIRNFLQRKCV